MKQKTTETLKRLTIKIMPFLILSIISLTLVIINKETILIAISFFLSGYITSAFLVIFYDKIFKDINKEENKK